MPLTALRGDWLLILVKKGFFAACMNGANVNLGDLFEKGFVVEDDVAKPLLTPPTKARIDSRCNIYGAGSYFCFRAIHYFLL